MKFTLSPTAVYGKPSRTEDFKVYAASGAIPAGVQKAAAVWAQAFLDSQGPFLVALYREDDGWWLLSVQTDGADSAGRPGAKVVFGQLRDAPGPRSVAPLLNAYGKECRAKKKGAEEVEAVPVEPDADGPGVIAAAVALALADNAAADTPGAAAAVLRLVPPHRLRWAALLPGGRLRTPPAGPGLVIGSPVAPSAESARFLQAYPNWEKLAALPWDRLAALPEAPAVRAGLAAVALGEILPLPADLSTPALVWLGGSQEGRSQALELVRPEQVVAWLDASEDVTAQEFLALRDRCRQVLAEEIHRLIVRNLGKTETGFRTYFALRPEDHVGLVALLPRGPDLDRRGPAEVWRLIHDGGPEVPGGPEVEGLFALLEGTPLPEAMPLPALAKAAESRARAAMKAFGRHLYKPGWVAKEVVQALLGGEQPAAAPAAVPTLAPDFSWLRGVLPDALLNCSSWVYAAEGPAAVNWKSWWVRCVEILLDTGRVERAAVIAQAARRREPDLLRRAGAPEAVVRLADPGGGRVALPPPQWVAQAAPLLGQLYRDGKLFDRLEAPLTSKGLEWLEAALPDENNRKEIGMIREHLEKGSRLAWQWLKGLLRVLHPDHVLLQIVARATELRHTQQDRAELESLLLKLAPEKQLWLRALLLTCDPLDRPPPWTTRELIHLFPLLDPVRDVLRVVLSRPTVEPEEGQLLSHLLRRLRNDPRAPLPPPTPEQRRRRPPWVQDLSKLPGWASFGGEPSGEPAVPAKAVHPSAEYKSPGGT